LGEVEDIESSAVRVQIVDCSDENTTQHMFYNILERYVIVINNGKLVYYLHRVSL